jgi:hypothetical protein
MALAQRWQVKDLLAEAHHADMRIQLMRNPAAIALPLQKCLDSSMPHISLAALIVPQYLAIFPAFFRTLLVAAVSPTYHT